MEAVDSYFPAPKRALDKPFSLPVEDVFSIQGRGTVVTGRIEQGIVKTGEEVEIVGINPILKSVVTGIVELRIAAHLDNDLMGIGIGGFSLSIDAVP